MRKNLRGSDGIEVRCPGIAVEPGQLKQQNILVVMSRCNIRPTMKGTGPPQTSLHLGSWNEALPGLSRLPRRSLARKESLFLRLQPASYGYKGRITRHCMRFVARSQMSLPRMQYQNSRRDTSPEILRLLAGSHVDTAGLL